MTTVLWWPLSRRGRHSRLFVGEEEIRPGTIGDGVLTCQNGQWHFKKTLQTARKFAFSRIPTKAHEISENYVIEGGEKEKIYGDDPV